MIDKEPIGAKRLNKKRLIDVLNYINFQNGTVLVNLQHKNYRSTISLPAYPQPCTDSCLCCTWASPPEISNIGSSYVFLNLVIDKALNLIMVDGKLLTMGKEGITISLPDYCHEFGSRKAKRYSCKNIVAELMQNGVLFSGSLIEFSCLSFAVELTAEPPQTFYWITPDRPVYVVFRKTSEVVYSGECSVTRQNEGKEKRIFVLEPSPGKITRFVREPSEEAGSMLSPLPSVVFQHPLSGRMENFDLACLSAVSFIVEEDLKDSGLFPGLVIPSVFLEFAPGFSIQCKAQVVTRNFGDAETLRHTLVILDMSVENQRRLSALMYKAMNKKSYVCARVDTDALWKFFFEAGFVYPGKYDAMQAYKERFRNLYEKIYLESPAIARHFIHQDRKTILGHISMIRFYQNTWLIQHHAAIGQSLAGITVLKQIGNNINDYRFLYSSHMDFAICYFRPENKFPNRFFGKYARTFNNLKGCSVDAFAYISLKSTEYAVAKQSKNRWEMNEATLEDLIELKHYYESTSGGLMLSALDLEPDTARLDELSTEYKRLGLKRERYLFSLQCNGRKKAILMVTVSDIGLNMSSLTNCIHVIVIDQVDLSWNLLSSYLVQLSCYYEAGEMALLIYPSSYVEFQQVVPDKIYNLWVLNCRYTEHFLAYVKSLLSHQAEEGREQNHG